MKDRNFYLHWISFIMGFFLGIFGFLLTLFATTNRRDKIYSSLLGWFLGTGIVLLLARFGGLELPTL
jgi:hypothetical protein